MATRTAHVDLGPIALTLTLQSRTVEAHALITDNPRPVDLALGQAMGAALTRLDWNNALSFLGVDRERQVETTAAASVPCSVVPGEGRDGG
jgi:hypothetical protein